MGPIVSMKNTIYALCKKLGSYVSILDELQTKVVSLWNSTFIPFGGVIWIFVYGTDISVRAMQYVLDMTMNSKKPDDLVHKLPYKCYRIRPLVLWPLPEDFEKLAYSEKFS